jgi:hypothetical protein
VSDVFQTLGAIREAMERNMKRCGSAADTPHTTVRAKITRWYEQRHWYLWSQFIRLSEDEPSIEHKSYFQQFYEVRWEYERQVYRDGNQPVTFAPSKSS